VKLRTGAVGRSRLVGVHSMWRWDRGAEGLFNAGKADLVLRWITAAPSSSLSWHRFPGRIDLRVQGCEAGLRGGRPSARGSEARRVITELFAGVASIYLDPGTGGPQPRSDRGSASAGPAQGRASDVRGVRPLLRRIRVGRSGDAIGTAGITGIGAVASPMAPVPPVIRVRRRDAVIWKVSPTTPQRG
jgi:hypothetical protein